jgi:diaminohydroxyphosphoribosylaminopyrimidine deaminase/5-amino-6-(5-phosphoribosylamino)uracil reductase
MKRAIELARAGLGKTGSNPIVGAVIFDQSGIIGEGFHQSGPHAEVVAINSAVRGTVGASIAVTLEPCSHFGKTPPCVDAILTAGISKVYYAVSDPNEEAAGGAQRLREAGVEVESGLLEHEASDANRFWIHAMKTARPFFTWKIASTLDGRIAAADGSSKWITSQISRDYVAVMRSQSDAILVGTGTVISDDPALLPHGYSQRPLRVVVGAREIPSGSHVCDGQAELLHLRSRDFTELASTLHARGIRSVLVEAGPTLGSAMLQAGMIDEIALFTAPKILGAGRSFIDDIGIATIGDALELEALQRLEFGGDSFVRYALGKRK